MRYNYRRREEASAKDISMLYKNIIKTYADFEAESRLRYQQHVALKRPCLTRLGSIDLSFVPQDLLTKTQDQPLFPDTTGDVNREATQLQRECYLETYQLPHDDSVLKHFARLWNWNRIAGYVFCQPPNRVVNNHVDMIRGLFRDYPRDHDMILAQHIRRRIVFLTDWQPGQVFCFGNEALVDWRLGDVIEFPWFMPHSTANGSDHTRCIITVTGTVIM
jgi:hypothetical protein